MILTNSDIPGWYMGGTSNQTLLRPTLLGKWVLSLFLPMMTSMVFAEAGGTQHDVSC